MLWNFVFILKYCVSYDDLAFVKIDFNVIYDLKTDSIWNFHFKFSIYSKCFGMYRISYYFCSLCLLVYDYSCLPIFVLFLLLCFLSNFSKSSYTMYWINVY